MTLENVLRDEIVVLMRDRDQYVDHDRLSLSELGNVVPCVGDRLTLHLEHEGLAVYRVEERYLADLRRSDGAGEDAQFWVLVVDQYDEDHSDSFDDLVRAIYRANFASVWFNTAKK